MKYDKAYFIAKFTAIPDERWTTGDYGDEKDARCRCALGHCQTTINEFNDECAALQGLLGHISHKEGNIKGSGAAIINDGDANAYQQPTPKARILAALHDLP